MSIRGIDSQIMITRTPDISKETSIVQQRPEINQQILAEQQVKQVTRYETRVKELEETDTENMRVNEEGGSGSQYESHGEKPHYEDELVDERGKPGMYVPAGDNILDIFV